MSDTLISSCYYVADYAVHENHQWEDGLMVQALGATQICSKCGAVRVPPVSVIEREKRWKEIQKLSGGKRLIAESEFYSKDAG